MPPAEDLEKGRDNDAPIAGPKDVTSRVDAAGTDVFTPSPDDDWLNQLDETSDIEILEYRQGSSKWETLPFSDVKDPLLLPDSVTVRLYLVEGLALDTLTYFSGVSRDFFHCHYRNVLPYSWSGFDSKCFFGKWSRRVYQDRTQWDIEDRISKGRPYNLDIIVDPRDIRLNHDRYERPQCIWRPYNSLEPSRNIDKSDTRHAIGECISYFYKRVSDGVICVLVFDAPRKVRIRKEEYRTLIKSPVQSTLDIILRFILDDHMDVMSDFREALDFIDEHMSDDGVLRSCLQDWRSLLGQWKSLSNDVSSLGYATGGLLIEPGLGTGNMDSPGQATKLTRTQSIVRTPRRAEFDKLAQEVKGLTERTAATFQAIMATMGIVESQKAIAQAETISKLTSLAFFFIPLTLCASIFGMNIVEWQNRLRTWIWVVVSLVILVLTYIALYASEIIIALSRSPEYFQTMSIKTASNINRWSLFLTYYSKRLLKFFFSQDGLITSSILALIVGVAVGIWAITNKTPLSYGNRVSVGVGFGIGAPALFFMWGKILDDACHSRMKLAISQVFLMVGIGVAIWAVLRYAPLPYSDRVSIAVGMGAGLPCLFTLRLMVWDNFATAREYISNALLLGALAPTLWAITTKMHLDQSTRISLSVGLVTGLPCLLQLYLLYDG